MASRTITLIVRLQGAAQSARGLAQVASQMHSLGVQSRRTSDMVRYVGHSMSMMGNVATNVGRRVSYTFMAMAAAVTKAGIQFNATMEAQTVAFGNLLGSDRKAKGFVKGLVTIAEQTPFQLTDVISGTRQLMAFGMAAEKSKETMQLMGDAIAVGAGGSDEIAHASRALGQIQAAGVLHAQDLNQLISANVLSLPRLTKRMNSDTKKFRKDMSLGKISAEKFFKALREMWSEDPLYKGAAAEHMKTYIGQVERLKDLYARASGALTETLFKTLSKKLIPAAAMFAADIQAIFSYKEWTAGEKMNAALEAFNARWKPLKEEFLNWWESNDMTERVRKGFEDAMAWLIPKAVEVAGMAIDALWQVWKDFDPKTKVITAVALLSLFGITQTVIATAGALLFAGLNAALFGGPGKRKGPAGGGTVGVMTVHANIVNVYGAGPRPPGPRPTPTPVPPPGGGPGWRGRLAGGVRGMAKGGPAAIAATLGSYWGATHIPGIKQLYASQEGKASMGDVLANHVYGMPGPGAGARTGGPQMYSDLGHGAVTGATRQGSRNQDLSMHLTTPVVIQIDGKTVASAVHNASTKKKSTR